MSSAGSTKFRSLGPKKSSQLSRLIGRFDKEAERCAAARAYYAACVMQGAVLEGLLISICDCYDDEVRSYLESLPATERPRGQLLRWDLDHLIKIAVALEWLPGRKRARGPRKIGDWLLLVKELRNLSHPGRHLRDYPNVTLRKAHYMDSYAIVRAASDHLYAKVTGDLSTEIEKYEHKRRTGS